MGSIETLYDDDGKIRGYQARWRERSGRQRKKQFRLKGQADKHVVAMEDAKSKRATDKLDPKVTVDELVTEYIDLSTGDLAESSIEAMLRRQKSHLTGTAFGRSAALDARYSDVAKWVKATRSKNAANTTRAALALVRSALGIALRDGRITENPATHKIVIREDEPTEDDADDDGPAEVLQLEEVTACLAAMHDPRRRIIAAVQAHTGLRVQEVLGLLREEIDLDQRIIKVRMQLHRHKGIRVRLKKSPAARRTVVIGDVLTELLRTYFDERPATNEWAFTDPEGSTWTYDAYRRHLERAGATVGLKVTTHSFRHFHASVLILANVNLLVIARRLGHSSTGQLEKTYAHILRPVDDVTRSAIDGAWRGTE